MGGFFGGAKEKDPPPPPAPAPLPADPAIKKAQADEAARLRRRKGLGKTILTRPGLGDADAAVARNTLLGGGA